jgi:hypothetical protein
MRKPLEMSKPMDVHCSTCGEPWDVYHLRHDAVFDTDLSEEEAQAWGSLSRKARLAEAPGRVAPDAAVFLPLPGGDPDGDAGWGASGA